MAALECPQCGSRNVININLTMEDGNPVSFYSCHNFNSYTNNDRPWLNGLNTYSMNSVAPTRNNLYQM